MNYSVQLVRLVFLFCILSLSVTVHAQFKEIQGTYGPIGNQSLLPSNGQRIVPSENTKPIPMQFRSLDGDAFLSRTTIIVPKYYNKKGIPVYFEGQVTADPGVDMERQVTSYMETLSSFYGVEASDFSFEVIDAEKDEIGMHHYTVQQYFNGVVVEEGMMKLHGKHGFIHSANGYLLPVSNLSTNPKVSIKDVQSKLEAVLKAKGQWASIDKLRSANIHLKRFTTDLLVTHDNDRTILAYKIDVYANLMQRFTYYMDAQTGEVLRFFKNYCELHGLAHQHNHANSSHNHDHDHSHGAHSCSPMGAETAVAKDLLNINRTINTYEVNGDYFLIDASRSMYNAGSSNMPNDPAGVIWTIDANNKDPKSSNFSYTQVASSNNSWSNKTGVSAHFNGGKAYEYFKNTFNRNSINGTGGNIISIINVADAGNTGLDNAFWNGAAMFYGNGKNLFLPLARALDVAGHEMSHGVIQATANLTYYGEPGAINESFADVFGVMIDRDDWTLGEDAVQPGKFPNNALRSMSDPHNGGSKLGDLGWQPKHTNEQYMGTQDNAGVHINSGIPNHAFYLFALKVGKDKAERVYYRALTKYLTKSSKFIDLRAAVEQSAKDLYGDSAKGEASVAFQAVGIGGGGGKDYEKDVDTNPGTEYVIFTDPSQNSLRIIDAAYSQDQLQLSDTPVLSKPSVTDDGSIIMYVGKDHKIYILQLDWQNNTVSKQVYQNDPVWRNVCISKDGKRLAALTKDLNNALIVLDFSKPAQQQFEFYNPTFSDGVSTGDVDFADAMEFDFTGEWLLYDAKSTITGATGNISYWDIGFINVFNNNSNEYGSGKIEKLFNQLPKETNVGNPSFSKNSPYILALDLINNNGNKVLAVNIEKNEVGEIWTNNVLGFPNYNYQDKKVIIDNKGNDGTLNLGEITMNADKINGDPNSGVYVINSAKLGQFIANGKRVLKNDAISDKIEVTLTPNPVSDILSIHAESVFEHATMYSLDGRKVLEQVLDAKQQVNVAELMSGFYTLVLKDGNKQVTQSFIKQ